MPTVNGDVLSYGQDQLIPSGTRSAWGARLIVTQDGYVDFVPDRQGCAGEQRDGFLTALQEECPASRLTDMIGQLLREGRMDTRVEEDLVIFKSSQLEIHANTNASAGYCYVTAWATASQEASSP